MPPLYRHIVPDAADKAGNGAPVYRGNAPSYQRAMNFRVKWVGDIDFAAFAAWYESEYPGVHVLTQSLSASRINAAWETGAPKGILSASPRAYGDLEVMRLDSRDDGFDCMAAALGSVDAYDPGDAEGSGSFLVSPHVYLEWDATNTAWRWIANFASGLSGGWMYVLTDDGGSARARFSGAQGDVTTFASPFTTASIRLGGGVQLSPLHITGVQGAWAQSGLAGCALEVSAEYA